ncbi:hypothetical protein M9Y10_028636 [Tritrichomonas musculus]|uniref:Protein kinase domain-containing protein n=1 Tax=Tritrichomonas musculus TaxID=1915356 RepID=A0ABR2KJX9_9EUKA
MNSSVKIAVLGDKKSGKTSFIQSFTYGSITDQPEVTMTNSFIEVVSLINGKETQLSFLDTSTIILSSASPQYNELMDMIKMCSGSIIILDLTNQYSLSTIANYIQIINNNIAIKSEILVIGNKSDLTDTRLISSQDISYLLSKYRFTYFEASFKNQRISNERRLQDFLSRLIGRIECHSIQIQFPHDVGQFELDVNTFKSIYKEKAKIGSGAFGEVIRAEDTRNHEEVAIKTISAEHLIPSDLNLFKREVIVLCRIRNIFLTNIIGFTSQNPFSIIMEYVPNGNLFHYIHQNRTGFAQDNTKKTIIAMGIAYGMAHIHDMKIIHRDLKSMNILLDKNFFPKICDFGVSKLDNSFKSTNFPIGTPQWMAPEMMNNENYTNKVDVYSYSMILYELLAQQVPFYRVSQPELVIKVVNRNERPKLPPNTPKPLEKLMKETWDRDPAKRPDFHAIFERFAIHQVEFEQTNRSDVDKFLNYIRMNNLQDPYLKKINSNVQHAQSQYQLPEIKTPPGIKIQQGPLSIFNTNQNNQIKLKNSNPSTQQKDIAAMKSENLFLDMKMKKNNDLNTNKLVGKSEAEFNLKDGDTQSDEDLSSNFDSLKDLTNQNYQQNFKLISDELTKRSILSFYDVLIKIFDCLKETNVKSKTEIYNIKMILNQLCDIIKRPHFISRFISSHILNHLPFEHPEFIDDSIKVLTSAIEVNANSVTKSFIPIFKPIIENFPKKVIPVYIDYIRNFESVYDPWPFLDSALQSYRYISSYAQNNEQEVTNEKGNDFIVSERYIFIFSYLCKNFPVYRKARCYNCSKYIMRMLPYIKGQSLIAAYSFLCTFYQNSFYFKTENTNDEFSVIEIEYGAINEHLLGVKTDQTIAYAALSFIKLLDKIMCDENKMIDLCKGLLRLAKTNADATLVLIQKIASTKNGYILLTQDQVIYRNPIPTYTNTFALFAELCRQNYIQYQNKGNQQNKISFIFADSIPLLFTRFLAKEPKAALSRISSFISVRNPNANPIHPLFNSQPIYEFSAENVTSLEENGFFSLLIENYQNSQLDIASIKEAFIIVRELSFYAFVQSFVIFVDILVQRYKLKDELQYISIDVLAFLVFKHTQCINQLKRHDLSFLSEEDRNDDCNRKKKFILSATQKI